MADAPDLAGTDATTPPRGFMSVVSSTPASAETAAPGVGVDSAEAAVSAAVSAAQQNCAPTGLC